MPLSNRLGLIVLAVLVVVVVGGVWLMRTTSQPAASSLTDSVAAVSAVTPTVMPTDASTVAAADTTAMTDTVTDTAAAADAANAPAATPRRFAIDPTRSQARFIVDEILFGNPNTVVGSTADVSGTITVDLADPTHTTVGPIRVNARTLATDNRFRNRSLTRLILQANQDAYQYITLTPTQIEGLPATAVAGEPLDLQVTGDLQIRDIVQLVTFSVTVTPTSESQLEGLAVATVQRADFDLNIPNVEGVADVTQDVRLELQFVAVAEE